MNSELDKIELVTRGVPGTEGKPNGPIARRFDETAFTDAMWLSDLQHETDVHIAFVADFTVDAASSTLELQVQAVAGFAVWLDGEPLVRGPLRFSPAVPEFNFSRHEVLRGTHRLAMQAHAEGVVTRSTSPIPSFAWIRLLDEGQQVPLTWRARRLDSFRSTGLRISPLQGWIEFQHIAEADWKSERTQDSPWTDPVSAYMSGYLGVATATDAPLPRATRVTTRPHARGQYRDTYTGYQWDDPTVQFLLADDRPASASDVDGQWLRYDLGRVRIGRMCLSVSTQTPAEVMIAYAERLGPDGRPAPTVALSTGPTRMIQYFKIDRGTTRIEPFQALAGQFIEVRVRSRGSAEVSDEEFVERDTLGDPRGQFDSPDSTLNRIWQVGIDTLRAAAEDSIVDSARERGEWVGDVSCALQILGAGWGDYSLVRRALLHAAAAARSDGLVAGCGPGELIYLGTYAAQWVTACVETARAEGTLAVLREFEANARANVEALVALVGSDGRHSLPWSFIDWGYSPQPEGPDVAVLCHVYMAVSSWRQWLELLGKRDEAASWNARHDRLRHLITGAEEGGYHSLVLREHAGLVLGDEVADRVLGYLRAGFPFDPSAPRLRDPLEALQHAITPYFSNHSIATLLRAGRGRDAADIWRRGWGWMLDQGATTWWEVFDDRWSRCHQWSGAPTWQLSRYGLGLRPAGPSETDASIQVNDLGLDSAAGKAFLPGGRLASVRWERRSRDSLRYELSVEDECVLNIAGVNQQIPAGETTFILERHVGDLYL